METHRCCICGSWFRGYGNNPAPVSNDEDARCCDTCNTEVVIPARLNQLYKRRTEKNDNRD